MAKNDLTFEFTCDPGITVVRCLYIDDKKANLKKFMLPNGYYKGSFDDFEVVGDLDVVVACRGKKPDLSWKLTILFKGKTFINTGKTDSKSISVCYDSHIV